MLYDLPRAALEAGRGRVKPRRGSEARGVGTQAVVVANVRYSVAPQVTRPGPVPGRLEAARECTNPWCG